MACIEELHDSNVQKVLHRFLTGIPLNNIHCYTGRSLWCLHRSLHALVIDCSVLYHYEGSDCYILKDINTGLVVVVCPVVVVVVVVVVGVYKEKNVMYYVVKSNSHIYPVKSDSCNKAFQFILRRSIIPK